MASRDGDQRAGYLVGLIGSGIGTSLSPALHEREADALGVRYLYRILDLDEFDLPATAVGDLVSAARLAGYHGLNITHPVKQLVLPHLDELSPEAAEVGAVNTVVFSGGRAVGHNTDLTGFAGGFREGLPDAALGSVALLGAGGAGSAVAHALLRMGAGTLHVFDVDPQRAANLATALSVRHGAGRAAPLTDEDALAHAVRDADGLVHATPTGMAAHPGLPLPAALVSPGMWVADIVYRPLETELLTEARKRGCRVLSGGPMAVHQAADAFRIITGREPDLARMRGHFDTLAHAELLGRQPHAHH
jgi:shikimate dehydrogenase